MRTGLPLLSLAVVALAAPALAQPTEALDLTQSEVEESHAATNASEGRRPSFVAMPIPEASPALGNGLAFGALLLYEPKGSGGVWTSGIGGLYTDTESWGVALFQKAHLREDQIRVTAGIGYADLNLEFYGVGGDAGERDISIDLNQKGTGVVLQGLYQVRPNLYVGARYRYIGVDTTLDVPAPPAFPDLDPPPRELGSQVSGLGLAAEYDTRDSEYGPTRGLYGSGQWLWNGDAIGSDFEYGKLTAAMNGYHGVGEGVLAWRGSICATGSRTPFYDLCMYGQANDLRGYETGQYRDRALWAGQVEYRRPLFWRFGGVVFAGVGGIAPGFDHLGDSTVLPSAGLGVRFAASKRFRINLSLDVAWGKDSSGVYFHLGEAF